MNKQLIIAEKPSVASDIAKALGGFKKVGSEKESWYESDTAVLSCARGHLVELNVPEAQAAGYGLDALPILPEQFGLEVIEGAGKQFALLKKLMGRADVSSLVNACDAGREGELIFRYIYLKAGSRKPMQRMWLQSMTLDAIQTAYKCMKPGHHYDSLYHAAICRSEADWLIGINSSRATAGLRERQIGVRESMSAGRVQTPTLAIIVHREIEILNFKPQDYWEVHGTFSAVQGSYTGRWVRTSKNTEDEADHLHRLTDAAQAQSIVQRCQGVAPTSVKDESKPVISPPPKLFDLTTLQREANTKFGLSAATTLEIAQALYEKYKSLTYPRTDASVLPEDYVETAKATLRTFSDTHYGEYAKTVLDNAWVKSEKRIFDNSKISDHFAIIPTGTIPDGITGEEAKIYDLVVRRFLAVFYPSAEYRQTVRTTEVAGECFRSSERVLVKEGWLSVYGKDAADNKSPPLCAIASDEKVTTDKVESVALKTRPPLRFSEATLLSAMEHAGTLVDDDNLRDAMKERGLGTPATRAATIERLLHPKINYIDRQGKYLVPTPKGLNLITFLEANGVGMLTSPKMTGEWEHKLHEMEIGKYNRSVFMDEIAAMAHQIVDTIRGKAAAMPSIEIKHLNASCPKCGGKVASQGRTFNCSACDFKLWKEIANRPLSEAEVNHLLRDHELPVANGFLSKTGKKFSAGLKLNSEFKIEFIFENDKQESSATAPGLEAKCPHCGDIVRDRGKTYACDKGDFKLWKEIAGRSLSVSEASVLIVEKEHPKITGFVSSKGKSFSAGLRLSHDYSKVEFVFEQRV